MLTLHCGPTLAGLTLARMLKGGVGIGAWCVLANLCTLSPQMLNVLSQAVHEAHLAIAAHAPTCRLDGAETRVDGRFALSGRARTP